MKPMPLPSFLAPLAGSYFGASLGLWPIEGHLYHTHQVAIGRPRAGENKGLFMTPGKNTGLHNFGMTWIVYDGARPRFGHAWDDNEPDDFGDPIEFEDWFAGQVRDLIRFRAAAEVAAVWSGPLRESGRSVLDEAVAIAQRLGGDSQFAIDAELALAILDQRAGRRVAVDVWKRCLSQTSRITEALPALAKLLSDTELAEAFRGRAERDVAKMSLAYDDGHAPATWSKLVEDTASLPPAAVAVWAEITRTLVVSTTLLHIAADVLARAGHRAYAIALLERALELDPRSTTLATQLQACYLEEGRTDDAAAIGARVSAIDLPSEVDDDVQAYIDEYGRLCNQFASCDPGGKDPDARGRRLVELEAALNRYWREHPKRELAIAQGRFLSAGSAGYVGWLRNQKRYDEAVAHVEAQLVDLELAELRDRSNGVAFERFLNNGLGSFVDSGKAKHVARAVELVDGLESVTKLGRIGDLQYQLACVFARAGRRERALRHVAKAIEMGESGKVMAADSDLISLRDDPEFRRLVARS